MAGRISITPTDPDIFNVVQIQNTVLMIWNDSIYYMSPDEAIRLGQLLTNLGTREQKAGV